MELRHLKYFIAVAEELHFGRAAQRLQMAQPPLSQQIKQLESELDAVLFERTKQRVELTNAGKVFLQRAYEIVNHINLSCEEAGRIHRGEAGQLILAFTGALAFDLLPSLVRSYRAKHPNINIVLRQLTTSEQVDALHGRTIHAGLLIPPIDSDSLNVEILREESYVVALPITHPLASLQGAIDLSLLANDLFVMTPREAGTSYYDSIISLCQNAGFSPQKAQEALELPTVTSLVAAGMGIAILPSSIQSLKNNQIVYLPLQESLTTYKFAVAWHKQENSPIISSFISFLREHFNLEVISN
ncbi:LysR family transcriptional regulator [Neobacillus citreus]|uniref:LysR family transcriptional regulator n=1 Tax=Neobacillus citreus TaxID=2833578 RepID=A0A942T6E4_9BACI|nr:LysR family transcriptional regulator [Neobacillus citreus]